MDVIRLSGRKWCALRLFIALAELGRFHSPTGAFLLLFPCWWGVALASAGRPLDLRLLALFALGAWAMRAAGCALNDIVDRDIDREVARTRHRPLSSGRVTIPQAFLFMLGMTLIGGGVVLLLPLPARVVAIACLPVVALYPFMKRLVRWPQVVLAIIFNWGVLVAAVAVQGELGGAALSLYAAAFFWTLLYDTIYAQQDCADDRDLGVGSLALVFGPRLPSALRFFAAAFLFFLAVAGALAGLAPGPFLFGWLASGLVIWWLLRGIDLSQAASCARAFRRNLWVGLVVFAALAI